MSKIKSLISNKGLILRRDFLKVKDESKKIFITGAEGFIGKNLTEELDGKFEIKYLKRNKLDLCNTEMVEDYLEENKFDVIIHAANTNDTRNKSVEGYEVVDGNLRMFFNLERCKQYYGKMYYFGSGAEYDMRHYVPDMKEDYFGTYIPRDPYGFSKYIMSKSCGKAENICDLRLFGVYGKYEEWERRFISNAICRALKGMDITIQKNVYFDYLWVQDLCDIMKWFIENEPAYHHYNVCRGTKIDLYSLACLVREMLNVDCNIVVAEPGWKLEYTGNNERLLEEIGDFQFTSFEESIRKLCDYYKEHLDEIDETKLI